MALLIHFQNFSKLARKLVVKPVIDLNHTTALVLFTLTQLLLPLTPHVHFFFDFSDGDHDWTCGRCCAGATGEIRVFWAHERGDAEVLEETEVGVGCHGGEVKACGGEEYREHERPACVGDRLESAMFIAGFKVKTLVLED